MSMRQPLTVTLLERPMQLLILDTESLEAVIANELLQDLRA